MSDFASRLKALMEESNVSASDLPVNLEKLKEQNHAHTSKCQEIAKEVEKWGKKTKPNLSFLNPKR